MTVLLLMHWQLILRSGMSGKILFVVSTLADITSYKQLQKKLVESTYIDYLTGLYNIRYLYKRLEEEVSRAERKGEKLPS